MRNKTFDTRLVIGVVMLCTLIVFSLISFVNHYLCRTYCLDLGYYTQCMWDYAHGRMNQSVIFLNHPKPCLASHIDLYLLVFSPLVYLFGSYTLLILQIVFLLVGCYGMFKLLSLYTDNPWIPILSAVSFSAFFGVLHSVAFDYHSDVIVASVLPCFFYLFKQKRYIVSGFLLVFMLIGKENVGLLMIFVSVGLMWDKRKDRKSLWVLLGFLIFSILYTLLVLKWIMPSLDKESATGTYGGLSRYTDWGYTASEILKNLLTHPVKAVSSLFNHGNKVEFWICLLLSGALIGLGKPNYLFMTIPLIAQKMFTYDPSLWGISNQYNVLFAPIVLTACFVTVSKLPRQNWSSVVSVVTALLVLVTTFYTTCHPRTWIRRGNVAFYSRIHYQQSNFDVKDAYRFMEMIPKNASVCASTCFCPHLCFRDSIYVFPHEKMFETEYVLLTRDFPKQDISMFGEGYDTLAASPNLTLLHKMPSVYP